MLISVPGLEAPKAAPEKLQLAIGPASRLGNTVLIGQDLAEHEPNLSSAHERVAAGLAMSAPCRAKDLDAGPRNRFLSRGVIDFPERNAELDLDGVWGVRQL